MLKLKPGSNCAVSQCPCCSMLALHWMNGWIRNTKSTSSLINDSDLGVILSLNRLTFGPKGEVALTIFTLNAQNRSS